MISTSRGYLINYYRNTAIQVFITSAEAFTLRGTTYQTDDLRHILLEYFDILHLQLKMAILGINLQSVVFEKGIVK